MINMDDDTEINVIDLTTKLYDGNFSGATKARIPTMGREGLFPSQVGDQIGFSVEDIHKQVAIDPNLLDAWQRYLTNLESYYFGRWQSKRIDTKDMEFVKSEILNEKLHTIGDGEAGKRASEMLIAVTPEINTKQRKAMCETILAKSKLESNKLAMDMMRINDG